jgi:putative hydrolase of the HAD superfamily
MSRAIRAISFDLDDTLWSCDEVIERAEAIVYDWLQRHAPRITEAYSLDGMRELRGRTAEQWPALGVDLTALRHETVAWHAREAGYDPGLADEAVEVFLAERNRVSPFDDVRPVLEGLRRHYPLVAVTNGNADVDRAGVGDLFDAAFGAADVGAPKPDPRLFDAVCHALGIRAGELMHVGDDPVRDVHAGRSYGARSVWLDRYGLVWPEGVPRAHHELASLVELPEILGIERGSTRAGS